MIPKIIHYCWFGGNEMPQAIKECIATWDKLKGFEIKRWDESNCSLDENDFVKKAYAEKRWAFVSDYYRLKALKEYGGIYLDTDVKIHKNLEPLLKYKFFIGYMVNCRLCTAVFGAEKNSEIIKDLLHMYDITSFVESDSGLYSWAYNKENDELIVNRFRTNNNYFMQYFLEKFPTLSRRNKFQLFDDGVAVYPKEYFEIGSLMGKHYAVHLNIGSWKNTVKKEEKLYNKLKKILLKTIFGEYVRIIVRKRRYIKLNRRYEDYYSSLAKKIRNSQSNSFDSNV